MQQLRYHSSNSMTSEVHEQYQISIVPLTAILSPLQYALPVTSTSDSRVYNHIASHPGLSPRSTPPRTASSSSKNTIESPPPHNFPTSPATTPASCGPYVDDVSQLAHIGCILESLRIKSWVERSSARVSSMTSSPFYSNQSMHTCIH
jgi:hypothetical protein